MNLKASSAIRLVGFLEFQVNDWMIVVQVMRPLQQTRIVH